MLQVNGLRHFFEKHGFAVSTRLAEFLGMSVKNVRLFFIYAAFTNAIIVVIYLSMVFILKVRNHFKYRKRKSVFDL